MITCCACVPERLPSVRAEASSVVWKIRRFLVDSGWWVKRALWGAGCGEEAAARICRPR